MDNDVSRRQFLGQAAGAGVGFMVGPGLLAAASEGAATEEEPGMTERPVFRTDRPDGRFVSTAGFVHAYMKANPPKLQFDPEMKPEQFSAWQQSVRDKLRELMRFPDVPKQPDPKHLWTEQRDGYELQKWEAYPEPLSVVPFLALVPDGVSSQSPAPGVLCLPGSNHSKESLAGEPELDGSKPGTAHWLANRMALWYARAGTVAVAVENPGTCETADPIRPGRNEICVAAIWVGRHYEGTSVFQKLPILEWMRRQHYVDPERIAVGGHSLGAKPALHLAVLDPTIAAVVHNEVVRYWREDAIVTNLRHYGFHHYIPGFVEWFDWADLMMALAPRPLLISEGGRTMDIEAVRRAYELVGAERKFKAVYYPTYRDPAMRREDEEFPEGLSPEEYLERIYIKASEHYFKHDVAVPWLSRMLRRRGRTGG